MSRHRPKRLGFRLSAMRAALADVQPDTVLPWPQDPPSPGEVAEARGSRFPVKVPKAITSHDVQAAVDELLPRKPEAGAPSPTRPDWWPTFSRRLDALRAVEGVPEEVLAELERFALRAAGYGPSDNQGATTHELRRTG